MDKAKHIQALIDYLPAVDYGSSGAHVRILQKIMSEYGWYDGVISGEVSEETVKAIKLTQIALGLETDGRCGRDMWEALLS